MIPKLYEDSEILVVDKPAGLAVQPGAGVRISLVDAVERDYGFRPYLVHRLDKETAGCLVLAKDSRAAGRWTREIESRSVRKIYRAVCGRTAAFDLKGGEGRIETPVRVKGQSFAARTDWRLLGCFGLASNVTAAGIQPAEAGSSLPSAIGDADVSRTDSNLVSDNNPESFLYFELELGTGRMHQIRIHLAGSGAPVLGDDLHGDFRLNKQLRRQHGLKRLLLLAYRLMLPDGQTIAASIPQYFSDFMGAFSDSPKADCP